MGFHRLGVWLAIEKNLFDLASSGGRNGDLHRQFAARISGAFAYVISLQSIADPDRVRPGRPPAGYFPLEDDL